MLSISPPLQKKGGEGESRVRGIKRARTELLY